MRTRAAVLYAPHTEYKIEEIELDEPKANEVLVRFVASGMCHSDEHMVTGDMAMDPAIIEMLGWQQYPIILGHEGGGIVEKVGPGVTELKAGDRILTNRMTVAQVATIDVSATWRDDHRAIHVSFEKPVVGGTCFLDDEQVLVME
jgi:Zn-dependent alcohol dehydrogenase